MGARPTVLSFLHGGPGAIGSLKGFELAFRSGTGIAKPLQESNIP